MCGPKEFNSTKIHLHLAYWGSWINRNDVRKNAHSFHHICMEKARYKFLIMIIIIGGDVALKKLAIIIKV